MTVRPFTKDEREDILLGREERWLDGVEPALKVANYGADVLRSVVAETVAA